MRGVNGIHHVTAISGPAQENLDFYAGVLGMRLVKRSVNQDDPGTYHLFYADAEGRPGTDLTFFPWAHLAPPRMGHGLASEVELEVPPGCLDYWGERLEKYGRDRQARNALRRKALPLTDPHGLRVALVEGAGEARRSRRGTTAPSPRSARFAACTARGCWNATPPRPRHSSRGPGVRELAHENGWTRYGFDRRPVCSTSASRGSPHRGAWGIGAIHHLAWRVDDEAHQREVRGPLEGAGRVAPPR